MTTVYVDPGQLPNLNNALAAAGPGGEVRIRGAHPQVKKLIPLNRPGVRIIHDDGILRGTRSATVAGNPLFRLDPGADGLTFENFNVEDFGNGFLITHSTTRTNVLIVRGLTSHNMIRSLTLLGTLVGGTFEGLSSSLYSKGIQVGGDSHDLYFDSVVGDSEGVDGGFAMGMHFVDTAHHVTIRNATLLNHVHTLSAYYNGDGLVMEDQTYDFELVGLRLFDNADAGADIKAKHVRGVDIVCAGNKRNFRAWNKDVVLRDLTLSNPVKLGGTGTVEQFHAPALLTADVDILGVTVDPPMDFLVEGASQVRTWVPA